MNNITLFLQNFRAQGGAKGKLKNKLFASVMQGFEAIAKDLENIAAETAECSRRIEELSAENEKLRNEVEKLGNDIYSKSEATASLRRDFESACENLRNNNTAIASLSADCELLRLKLSRIEKSGTVQKAPGQTSAEVAVVGTSESPSDYDCIDYFDFENHFRGSIESIKKAQEAYLPYFRDKKNVLDIGCGRGEFLSLMQDNGINAVGVDIYEPYVDYCNMKGLRAVCGDGVKYLSQCGEVDGIFLGQVVEHLKIGQITELCSAAYEKLTEGGCIVIETPNPTSLAIYTNAFYIDPSHVKPVHPLTMKYCLEKAGFKNTEIIYTESSRPQQTIPPLEIEGAESFNEAMNHVSAVLYGSQDYAVIAVK